MRVLVTGGSGFIGNHLARALARSGVDVMVLDVMDFPGPAACGAPIEYRKGSVLDDAAVEPAIREAHVAVHLAGIAEPMLYGSDPLATLDVNLLGTIKVARLCAAHRVPMVFSSTSEIYGDNPALPWSEDSGRVMGPVSSVRWCYATAKAAAEHYLDACHRQLGLNYTVARLFNVYGPGLKGRVVDGFIRRALAHEPLVIHGDGSQTRCFTHVGDAVEAFMRIVARPIEGAHTYNVGDDTETSIGDLARLTIDLCHSRSAATFVPHREVYPGFEDVRRRRPDLRAIRRDLGWRPATALRDGLRMTVEAMRDGH